LIQLTTLFAYQTIQLRIPGFLVYCKYM